MATMPAAVQIAVDHLKSSAEQLSQEIRTGIDVLAAAPFGHILIAAALLLGFVLALRLALGVISFVHVYFLRPAKNLKTYGSWAVVTGATDGIGKAYSVQLAKKGLNLVIISRTQAKLDACAEELRSAYGVEVKTCAADLAKINAAAVGRIGATLAELEVGLLVNNAGMSYDHPAYLEEVDSQVDIDMITINTVAPTLLAKLVLPGMIKRRRGAIVNVGSGNGLLPAVPLLATYAGTKSYVNQFSRSLGAEVAAHGVSVQDQPPLYVATKMSKIRRPRLDAPTPDAWARAAVRQVGYGTSRTPYWYHAIMLAAITALAPGFLVTRRVRAMHVGFRAAALRRKARKAAAAAAAAAAGEGQGAAAAEPKKRV